jgi:fused signal recognition particle receptor
MDWLYILLPLVIILIAFFVFKTKPKALPPKVDKGIVEVKVEEVHRPELQEIVKEAVVPVKKEISFSDRLKLGLSRSRSEVWGKLSNLFTGPSLDDNTIESIEDCYTVPILVQRQWEN